MGDIYSGSLNASWPRLHAAVNDPELPRRLTPDITRPNPFWPGAGGSVGSAPSTARQLPVRYALVEDFQQEFALAVFHSNRLSSCEMGRGVGSNWDITREICQAVFQGQDVSKDMPPANNYGSSLLRQQWARDAMFYSTSPDCAARAKDEIVGHAQALSYLIDHIILKNNPWSEGCICKAHDILFSKLNGSSAGVYRTTELRVTIDDPDAGRWTRDLDPSLISSKMETVLSCLNDEERQARTNGWMEAFTTAARYHSFLINVIRPFDVGNRIIGRLIMQVLLLKYTGRFCLFGAGMEAAWEYLCCTEVNNQRYWANNGEMDWGVYDELGGFLYHKMMDDSW